MDAESHDEIEGGRIGTFLCEAYTLKSSNDLGKQIHVSIFYEIHIKSLSLTLLNDQLLVNIYTSNHDGFSFGSAIHILD